MASSLFLDDSSFQIEPKERVRIDPSVRDKVKLQLPGNMSKISTGMVDSLKTAALKYIAELPTAMDPESRYENDLTSEMFKITNILLRTGAFHVNHAGGAARNGKLSFTSETQLTSLIGQLIVHLHVGDDKPINLRRKHGLDMNTIFMLRLKLQLVNMCCYIVRTWQSSRVDFALALFANDILKSTFATASWEAVQDAVRSFEIEGASSSDSMNFTNPVASADLSQPAGNASPRSPRSSAVSL
eukprot:SAG11_NODE_3778_length_2233_cov_1.310216_1_plen_242_part_10